MKKEKHIKNGWSSKIKATAIITVLMLIVTSVLVIASQTPIYSKPEILTPLGAGESESSIRIGSDNDTTIITMREYYNTGEDSSETICSSTIWAQTFTVGTVGLNKNFRLTFIKIKLGDVPESMEKVRFYIYEFDSTGPTFTMIGEQRVEYNDLSDGWNTICFLTNWNSEISDPQIVLLYEDQQYAIGIFGVAVPDADILMDSSSPTYAGGTLWHKGMMPPVWYEDAPEVDMLFEVWGYTTSPRGVHILGDVHIGGG